MLYQYHLWLSFGPIKKRQTSGLYFSEDLNKSVLFFQLGYGLLLDNYTANLLMSHFLQQDMTEGKIYDSSL